MSDFKVSDILLSKGNARSIIDIDELSVEELDKIIKRACDIMENPKKYSKACEGKKLATLFYEPSTRTRLSFEAAMMELGGNVLGFSSASSASVSKGESVSDTAKVISCYADIIAMRHPYEGAPLVAAESASIPLINAGDGGHAHPTQTLADLLTIYREHGRLNNMVIGLCGDLKYGRTVHSLIKAMIRYEGVSFVLISPRELSLPAYIKTEVLEKNNVTFAETTSLEEAIPKLDILYMTRIQRERFDDLDEYERLKDSYVLTKSKLAAAKESMSVLHPLPRVNEISVDVDDDSRACYFKQALYGKFMRMSLILSLLEGSAGTIREKVTAQDKKKPKCRNPKCISQIEQELPQRFKIGTDACTRCAYCDNLIESN
ncbi:Aspartate carbamoyltransferase [[Eubacterium] infirmum]|nr:Aspartate carbamoyltransferase [[Eubacterium] infirmum]